MKEPKSIPELESEYASDAVFSTLLRLDQKRRGELPSSSNTATSFSQLAPIFGNKVAEDNARARRKRVFEMWRSNTPWKEIAEAEGIKKSMAEKLLRQYKEKDLETDKK